MKEKAKHIKVKMVKSRVITLRAHAEIPKVYETIDISFNVHGDLAANIRHTNYSL